MEFHLAFNPKSFAVKIAHRHKLLLVGSCFTEQIGAKLKQHKFSVLENPNGILFNPISITKALTAYIENKETHATDLFYQNECWNSWAHHSRFSNPGQEACLKGINESTKTAHAFLKQADWILITLGSAFVYELEDREVVANCHKVPPDKFIKRLLKVEEVMAALDNCMHRIFMNNPGTRIIFTISPVRHLRDGFVENNRSKAILIQAVHQLVEKFDNLFYFPAYELVIDDLRDYRFYAEDMVHPNYAATNYVWEKFVATAIEEPAQQLMKAINEINAARHHKVFNADSEQHKKFLSTYAEKVRILQQQQEHLDLSEEMSYFKL